MKRTAILKEINAMMCEYSNEINRVIRPTMEIISDLNFHKLNYIIRLTNGLMILDLIYENENTRISITKDYSQKLIDFDIKEISETTIYFEKVIDLERISEILSILR